MTVHVLFVRFFRPSWHYVYSKQYRKRSRASQAKRFDIIATHAREWNKRCYKFIHSSWELNQNHPLTLSIHHPSNIYIYNHLWSIYIPSIQSSIYLQSSIYIHPSNHLSILSIFTIIYFTIIYLYSIHPIIYVSSIHSHFSKACFSYSLIQYS